MARNKSPLRTLSDTLRTSRKAVPNELPAARQPRFEVLETRVLLSVNTAVAEDDLVVASAPAFDTSESYSHVAEQIDSGVASWLADSLELDSSPSLLADEDDVLTVIIDFIDPGQPDGVDIFGNVVTTFDVQSFGFDQNDYDLVTESVLEEVRGHYYNIPTNDLFPESAIPVGMELAVEFYLGDQGTPPENGSSEFYYMQIGTAVSGPCTDPGVLGCAGLNSIRSEVGTAGIPGRVVGSVFSDRIQGIGGLFPGDALSSGNVELTSNALGGTTSHEIGHAVSLNHLAKAGSVTPNGFAPIMGTGAIGLPNQDRIREREFAFSGTNPQINNQQQFHVAQLVDAIGLTEAGSGPRGGIIVSTLVDESDGNFDEGDLSLREALELLNSGQESIASITFAEGLTGTITLDPNLGSLLIEQSVSVTGPGADVISIESPGLSPDLIGDGTSIFVIESNSNSSTLPSVTISSLTLENADTSTGGAVLNSGGNVSLENLVIQNNSVLGFGGAIASGIIEEGSISISGSTLRNNSAGLEGGAIYTTRDLVIESSTIHDNHSGADGGAVEVEFSPFFSPQVEVINSTISGNTSVGNGGGFHFADENSIIDIKHSTIVNNVAGGSGGGFYIYNGVLALDHTIVASNSDAGTAPDIDNLNLFAAPAVLSKFSLIGNNLGSSITELQDNLIGNPGATIDPLLLPLANNGGATQTRKPMVDSPVVDAGDVNIPLPPISDQRGDSRIQFNSIDIGAVEFEGPGDLFIVSTLVDENDGDFSDGDFSLREAILRANEQPGPSIIEFDPSLNGGTIDLAPALGSLLINTEITIDAMGLISGLTINAATLDPTPVTNNGDGSRIFMFDDGDALSFTPVNLMGLDLVGGDVTGDGGAIYSKENLTLSFVTVSDSAATQNGGGIFHMDGMLTINNSTVYNNEAAGDGGGLHSNTSLSGDEIASVSNSTFSGNISQDEGGGIFNFDGLLSISNVTITDNHALKGGGLVSFGDPFTKTQVYSSIISGNTGLDVERSRNTAYISIESLDFNLVGNGNAAFAFNQDSDQSQVLDPMLAALADNGGRTLTHAILSGSPAIDAGDFTFDGSELFDQRGTPFERQVDGDNNGSAIIDVGAFEFIPPPPDTDFDNDGITTGSDFMAWIRNVGTTSGATNAQGDSDGDGDVDYDDLNNWKNNFTNTILQPDNNSSSTSELRLATGKQQLVPLGSTNPQSAILRSAPKQTLRTEITSIIDTQGLSKPTSGRETDISSIAARLGLFSAWGEGEHDKDFDSSTITQVSLVVDDYSIRELTSTSPRSESSILVDELETHRKASSVDLALEKLEDLGLRGFDPFDS